MKDIWSFYSEHWYIPIQSFCYSDLYGKLLSNQFLTTFLLPLKGRINNIFQHPLEKESSFLAQLIKIEKIEVLGLGYIKTCGWHQMPFEISFMPPIGIQKKGRKEFQ